MESKINDKEEQLKELANYHNFVDEYCKHTGITLFQYEKQRYMAGKGYADYPEPELHNPDREKL